MLAIIWNPIFGFDGMLVIQFSRRPVIHKAVVPKTCDGHHQLPERYDPINRHLPWRGINRQ